MKRQQKRKNNPSLAHYICISLLVLAVALIIGAAVNLILSAIVRENTSSEHIIGMLEGIIGAIAAGLVLFQLKAAEKAETHQNEIEEAAFLLQYNQTFIQDENMLEVEHLLEDQVYYNLTVEEIITKVNRQKFINYLVYLESLAPLILNGVLTLEHIDNLMAYRFFLAIDNCEVQEKELKPFAEYYRGCFKIYRIWRDYRKNKGLTTPFEDCKNKNAMQELSRWDKYDYYAQL